MNEIKGAVGFVGDSIAVGGGRFFRYFSVEFGEEVWRDFCVPVALDAYFRHAQGLQESSTFFVRGRKNGSELAAIQFPDGRIFYNARWAATGLRKALIGTMLLPFFGLGVIPLISSIAPFVRHFLNKRVAGRGGIAL